MSSPGIASQEAALLCRGSCRSAANYSLRAVACVKWLPCAVEEQKRKRKGVNIDLTSRKAHVGHQVKDEPCDYIIHGIPGGVKYFGELEEHCFWGNEVKLYEHHVDKLFAMFWHNKPKIEYYVCTINKTFAKLGQRMYFQVEYTEDKLQKYIHEDDDTLPLKLADGTVSCDTRFMLGTDKGATITTNWSWFRHHANIHEGDICAFHFKRKEGRRLSLTVHRL